MADKTFIEKYPEFKGHQTSCECCIEHNLIKKILDKHFVRKEEHRKLWRNMDGLLNSYMEGRKTIGKQKVKEAIDKVIPLNIESAQNMILNNQLKKELGLDK